MGERPRPRILVLGGGFVGMSTALGLERRLAPDEAELTLVSPENFMCFQPLLPEVASGSVEPRHAVVPLRRALRRTQVILGEVTGLDHARRLVTVEASGSGSRELPYDQVVVGIGSVTKVLPVPGLVEHAVGFQTLTEAIHLRNQVLARLEAAEAATDPAVRRRALTFVFVGGGYAGVEALAELHALARAACSSYRSLSASDMRWIVVEATDRILPSIDGRLARHAADLLRGRGIEIRLGTVLESAEDGVLRFSDGEELESDTLVWMPGIAPHPLAVTLGLPHDEQGRLQVEPTLQVRGTRDVWAAGDCAAVPTPAGDLYPPTAQHAEREGRHIARNLVRVLRGQLPEPFRYRSRGEFVTLGGRRAVASVLGQEVDGALAWALRRGYYLARMPSVQRRLRLLLGWAIDLPFPTDVAQIGSEQHPDRPLALAAGSR